MGRTSGAGPALLRYLNEPDVEFPLKQIVPSPRGRERNLKTRHGVERPRTTHPGEDSTIQERRGRLEDLQEIGKSLINARYY